MTRLQRTTLALALLILTAPLIGCNATANRANRLGKQYFDAGYISQAINEFQTALNKNPRHPNALQNMAMALYSMGKQQRNSQWLNQAEQLFRQAISANGQNPEAHRGLASLLIETGREKSAFDLLNGWMQRSPNSADPAIELARLYQEYGDNRRAVDLLTDALKISPQNIRALKAMGHVRELQGETELALQNYLRVLQRDGQQSEVANRVAVLQNLVRSPNLAQRTDIQRPTIYQAQLQPVAPNNSANQFRQATMGTQQQPAQSNNVSGAGWRPVQPRPNLSGVLGTGTQSRYGAIDPYRR